MKHSAEMPDTLKLPSAVTMASARALLAEGRVRAGSGDLIVDLSAVTEADSSALALLFDWMRVANAAGHRLTVRGLTSELASLSALYGVAELIPADA